MTYIHYSYVSFPFRLESRTTMNKVHGWKDKEINIPTLR